MAISRLISTWFGHIIHQNTCIFPQESSHALRFLCRHVVEEIRQKPTLGDGGSITNMVKCAKKAYKTSSNTPKLLSVTFYVPSRFQQDQKHIPMPYTKGEMSHLVLCIPAVFTNQNSQLKARLRIDLMILLSEVRNSSFQFNVWKMHKAGTKSRRKKKGGRMGI